MSLHGLVTGTLFADAEQRTSASGKPFAKASIALRDGDACTWVRLVAFGSLADELAALRKGDAVSASGRLKATAYTDKHGQPAASLEVVVERLLPLTAPAKLNAKVRSVPAPRRVEAPAPAPAGPLADWPSDI
jgi:single-stranded DNA-binding protein